MNYQKQANEFAKKHGIKLSAIGEPEYRKYFSDDEDYRFVFKMRLQRKGKKYTFTFGQSISDGDKEPSMYDVLTCLTKYPVESFEDFCAEYGYNQDSIKDHKVYLAVKKEWENVERLFDDILEELREIQ